MQAKQELNLTTRRNDIPKPLGFLNKKAGADFYKAKFSAAYQPEGHDFNQSFKVLRSAYWLRHGLLTKDDIFLYETLQFLCTDEIPFCLDVLADRCGIGPGTLRKCLDNLENAELLEIHKTDGRGAPNFYILRTPLFEQDSLLPTGDDRRDQSAQRRQQRILNAGGTLPAEFLEDALPRLRQQIKKNRARRLRDLARRDYVKSKLFGRFRRNLDEKRVCWYKLVKLAGDNRRAAEIENIIYMLAKAIPPSDSNYEEFRRRFREELELREIHCSLELQQAAQSLVAFFDRYRREPADAPARSNAPAKSAPAKSAPATKTPAAAPTTAPAAAITRQATPPAAIQTATAELKAYILRRPNLSELANVCEAYLQTLYSDELKAILKGIVDAATFKHLTEQLLL